ETDFSRKYEEKSAFFDLEYIDFKVAGTSHYQKDIKKAIKIEDEDSFFFDEKYGGMTNKEIIESTFDEPIFIYHNVLFSNCELRLEENNKYDPEAIAVYVNDCKVGHVPRKNFQEGKKYIYDQLKGGIRHPISASLYGGKYKVNRDDTKIETGETDYKIECQIVIKTDK
ncbi:HIRAN domain-containing protein, partial [Bacillus subtilis]